MGVGIVFCRVRGAWGVLNFGIFFILLESVVVVEVIFALVGKLICELIVTGFGITFVVPFLAKLWYLVLSLLVKVTVV